MTIREAIQHIENVISNDTNYMDLLEEEIEFVNKNLETLDILNEFLKYFDKEKTEETIEFKTRKDVNEIRRSIAQEIADSIAIAKYTALAEHNILGLLKDYFKHDIRIENNLLEVFSNTDDYELIKAWLDLDE